MAEKLRIGTVMKHLRSRHAFALHVPSNVVFVRDGDRWREFTRSDRVLLLEKIQDAYDGTIDGYDFRMSELEWCINALAGDRRFDDLPLLAIADARSAADDGGDGFNLDGVRTDAEDE